MTRSSGVQVWRPFGQKMVDDYQKVNFFELNKTFFIILQVIFFWTVILKIYHCIIFVRNCWIRIQWFIVGFRLEITTQYCTVHPSDRLPHPLTSLQFKHVNPTKRPKGIESGVKTFNIHLICGSFSLYF